MIFRELIDTLNVKTIERVEIRDADNYEICNVPVINEKGLSPYLDSNVISWFPCGSPNKNATFTVLLDIGGE